MNINQIIRSKDTILAVGLFGAIIKDHPFDDNLLEFYSAVYGRENEISDMPSPARHLTYDCYTGNGYQLIFTGCEVDRLCRIPIGMTGIEITNSRLRLYKIGIQNGCFLDTEIQWMWKAILSAFHQSYIVGDFTAKHVELNDQKHGKGPFLFAFSENTYIDYSINGFGDDEIFLAEPDPFWGEKFQELKRWIKDTIGNNLALRIEHYGSTSIPNIPAKPILDILVEIPSFEILRSQIVPLLCTEDCSYSLFMNHPVFTKRTSFNGVRIAHIHMAPEGHEVWKGLAFRDYLRLNPVIAQEYAGLKRKLLTDYANDRNHYTMGKTDFVQRIENLVSSREIGN